MHRNAQPPLSPTEGKFQPANEAEIIEPVKFPNDRPPGYS